MVRGKVLPWILEPSQSKTVGQKTSIISGVPEPARYKNGAESTVRIEAIKATLFLNQRFKSKIKNNPSKMPIIILGNLIAKGLSPRKWTEIFCKAWYGRSVMSPLDNVPWPSIEESTTEDISFFDRPLGLMVGIINSNPIKASPNNRYPITKRCLYKKSLEITSFFT